ncbi:hypothetical protein EXIGLDRAFT_775676 [Exidia glandulosa HHB12029]|uniref:F-box domain-containing protein n=1 Tax=Exidia glandulosa HHB12029 TaxID=1314781 RepID=A0A165DTH1_EXIGL|nr:hypothetical protein EXIGLDRAFT_775676 [Exidia glandulosa HHB12029]
MSRVQLSADILSDIFLGMDSGIDGAFVVAQVCAYWRSTAFATPLLWSKVRITDVKITRITTSLALSQDLPLSIELLHIMPSVVEELVPHRHRIAFLFISYAHGDSASIKPLLCAGLEFCALKVLRATAGRNNLNQLRLDVALSAPLLHKLDLHGVALDDWKCLFTPSVTEIPWAENTPISGRDPPIPLKAVFDPPLHGRFWPVERRKFLFCHGYSVGLLLQDCANLESLSVDGPCGPQPGEFVPVGGVLSHLRYIELRTDFNTAWDVLQLVRSDGVVGEMDVQFPDIDLDRDTFTRRLFGAVVRGLGSATEFTFHWSNKIELRDTHGRVRRMHPLNDDYYWPWPELWLELNNHLSLHASLKTIYIGSPY